MKAVRVGGDLAATSHAFRFLDLVRAAGSRLDESRNGTFGATTSEIGLAAGETVC